MPGDYDIEYASPWAGANYFPVGKPGTNLQKFEKETWPELDRICREHVEAGIHYQDTVIYGREKDANSATGQWFQELVKEDAWFKNVVPDVRYNFLFRLSSHCVHIPGSTFALSDVYPLSSIRPRLFHFPSRHLSALRDPASRALLPLFSSPPSFP